MRLHVHGQFEAYLDSVGTFFYRAGSLKTLAMQIHLLLLINRFDYPQGAHCVGGVSDMLRFLTGILDPQNRKNQNKL